jgi:chromosome segregation ATPase
MTPDEKIETLTDLLRQTEGEKYRVMDQRDELRKENERLTREVAEITENRNQWASRMMELASAEAGRDAARAQVVKALERLEDDSDDYDADRVRDTIEILRGDQ